jgi:hypothetical protein
VKTNIFLIVYRSGLLTMQNVSDRNRRENHNILCSLTLCCFVFFENRAVYEIRYKNIVEPDRPMMAIRRMRIACWIPKATNTHSECVKFIVIPLQQWLHKGASGLRHT